MHAYDQYLMDIDQCFRKILYVLRKIKNKLKRKFIK